MRMIQTLLSKSIELPSPVLITGARGMLGWELAEKFKERLPQSRVICTDIDELDITNIDQVRSRFAECNPKCVINAAAYTDVDKAENERELALSLNAKGPSVLVKVCRETDCKLVHFSTDQVFDGNSRQPRTEQESAHPLNHYAATKLQGEQEVLSMSGSLVLRLQWLYGERKNRFTSLKDKATFTPFADQWGAPTWTRDVAEVLMVLIYRRAQGVFHFVYDDYATWAEVFEYVKREMGYSVALISKKTAEFNLPATRPLFSVLSNDKLKKFLGVEALGSWKDSLKEFLSMIKEKVA